MKVTGLDRVVVMVRDIDKALDFYEKKLGMRFRQLAADISERDGVMSYVCPETHLHLISPILPLPENAAPPMRKRVDLLKECEAVFMAITFKVDDVRGATSELKESGTRVQHAYSESHDYASIGMDNFAEVITSPEDTLDLVAGFAGYDPVSGAVRTVRQVETNPALKVTGLDRIIVMVRDMDKALKFFSGIIGTEFKELDPRIQARDANRGLVCHKTHLHLVQPRIPLPDTAPPPMKRGAELLKEHEAVILMLIFNVDDPHKASSELKQLGFDVIRTWDEGHNYASLGIDNLVEFLVDPKDTIGIPTVFSRYDRV